MIHVDIDLIGVPAFVVEVDPLQGDVRYLGVNSTHERATGIRAADVVGRTPRECLPHAIAAAVEWRYRSCIETREFQEYDEQLDLPTGCRWWRTSLTPELDPATGRVARILGVAVDITARKQLEQDMKSAAFTDDLTGLASRRRFSDLTRAAIASASRGGSTFSLVVVDLDGFKAINDAHGHVAGDAVLREVASRIRAALPNAALIARLGGDEFVALVLDTTDEQLDGTIYRLSDALCRRLAFDGVSINVRASVGGAVWRSGVTVEGLTACADARMYAAKAARGRPAFSEAAHPPRTAGRSASRDHLLMGSPAPKRTERAWTASPLL